MFFDFQPTTPRVPGTYFLRNLIWIGLWSFVQFQGSALFVFANFFEENLVLQSVGNVRGNIVDSNELAVWNQKPEISFTFPRLIAVFSESEQTFRGQNLKI